MARSHAVFLLVGTASLSGAGPAAATSYHFAGAHDRPSPNGAFILSYRHRGWATDELGRLLKDPDATEAEIRQAMREDDLEPLQRVFATDDRETPLWSFRTRSLVVRDERPGDGCLFVSDTGRGVAGVVNVPHRYTPGRYDKGIGFWTAGGGERALNYYTLPAWRLWPLDVPAVALLKQRTVPTVYGGFLMRTGETLHVHTLGLRDLDYDLATGERVGWRWNVPYLLTFAAVWGVPATCLAAAVLSRRGAAEPSPTNGERRSERPRPVWRGAFQHLGLIVVLGHAFALTAAVAAVEYLDHLDSVYSDANLALRTAWTVVPVTLSVATFSSPLVTLWAFTRLLKPKPIEVRLTDAAAFWLSAVVTTICGNILWTFTPF